MQQVRKVVGTLVEGVNNVTFSCNISIFLQECCHIEMTWKCIGPDLRKFDRMVLHFYRTKGLSLKMAVTIYSLVNSLLPMPYELSAQETIKWRHYSLSHFPNTAWNGRPGLLTLLLKLGVPLIHPSRSSNVAKSLRI